MNGLNSNGVAVDQDISLYVPWNGNISDRQMELKSVITIHKKNMRELCDLSSSLKVLPTFDTQYPVKRGQCENTKVQYLEKENKFSEILEQYNSEYNLLLEQEVQLQQEIQEIEKNFQKVAAKLKQSEEKEETAKNAYHLQKSSLNAAKKMYDNSFRMNIVVEPSVSDDVFTSTVFLDKENENFPIKFTISRSENKIIDFDASSMLPQSDSGDLKKLFKKVNNPQVLICMLRKLLFLRNIN
jgi:hypothetical protein